MDSIREGDWKKLKKLKDEKLQVASEKILAKIKSVIDGPETSSHEKYLKLWRVIKKEDNKISDMFDDLKRSNAIFKLAVWKRYGLLNGKEVEEFSEETQNRIESLNEVWR